MSYLTFHATVLCSCYLHCLIWLVRLSVCAVVLLLVLWAFVIFILLSCLTCPSIILCHRNLHCYLHCFIWIVWLLISFCIFATFFYSFDLFDYEYVQLLSSLSCLNCTSTVLCLLLSILLSSLFYWTCWRSSWVIVITIVLFDYHSVQLLSSLSNCTCHLPFCVIVTIIVILIVLFNLLDHQYVQLLSSLTCLTCLANVLCSCYLHCLIWLVCLSTCAVVLFDVFDYWHSVHLLSSFSCLTWRSTVLCHCYIHC